MQRELPIVQVSQQEVAPPSNETQVPATPRTSAAHTGLAAEHEDVQMRSPELTAWQVRSTGQSAFVKQNS